MKQAPQKSGQGGVIAVVLCVFLLLFMGLCTAVSSDEDYDEECAEEDEEEEAYEPVPVRRTPPRRVTSTTGQMAQRGALNAEISRNAPASRTLQPDVSYHYECGGGRHGTRFVSCAPMTAAGDAQAYPWVVVDFVSTTNASEIPSAQRHGSYTFRTPQGSSTTVYYYFDVQKLHGAAQRPSGTSGWAGNEAGWPETGADAASITRKAQQYYALQSELGTPFLNFSDFEQIVRQMVELHVDSYRQDARKFPLAGISRNWIKNNFDAMLQGGSCKLSGLVGADYERLHTLANMALSQNQELRLLLDARGVQAEYVSVGRQVRKLASDTRYAGFEAEILLGSPLQKLGAPLTFGQLRAHGSRMPAEIASTMYRMNQGWLRAHVQTGIAGTDCTYDDVHRLHFPTPDPLCKALSAASGSSVGIAVRQTDGTLNSLAERYRKTLCELLALQHFYQYYR